MNVLRTSPRAPASSTGPRVGAGHNLVSPLGQCRDAKLPTWAWRMGISGQGESSTAEAKGLRHGVVQELCSHALRQFLIDEREGHLLRVGRACDRHAPLVGARLAFGEDLDLSPGPLSYLFDT